MFWFIGLIVLAILIIVGILLLKLDKYRRYDSRYDSIGITLISVCVPLMFIFLIIAPMLYFSAKQEVNTFKKQKNYLEIHIPKTDVEDAALTTKKMNLNEWLYNAQYSKKHYAIFTFYPDEVEQFTEIK